jgi:PHD/YefM family antitoxin component YafN of YafNO toxin-antitoxin module
MRIDTRDMVSVSEVSQRGASWLISQVADQKRTLLVLKNSKPAVVVTTVEAVERLERIDETIEDIRLLAAALVRRAADNGATHSLGDVMDELGIDAGELES